MCCSYEVLIFSYDHLSSSNYACRTRESVITVTNANSPMVSSSFAPSSDIRSTKPNYAKHFTLPGYVRTVQGVILSTVWMSWSLSPVTRASSSIGMNTKNVLAVTNDTIKCKPQNFDADLSTWWLNILILFKVRTNRANLSKCQLSTSKFCLSYQSL